MHTLKDAASANQNIRWRKGKIGGEGEKLVENKDGAPRGAYLISKPKCSTRGYKDSSCFNTKSHERISPASRGHINKHSQQGHV